MMIQHSAFDTEHYGMRIGRLTLDDVGELATALAAARADGYAMLVLRISDGQTAMRGALEANGIQPLETLVTSVLEHPVVERRAGISSAIEHHDRLSVRDDIEAVEAFTAAAITTSHLHADPRLPLDKTRKAYAAWARNDVTGRAQRTILARVGTEIVGMTTVLIDTQWATIDLFAAHPAWHGRGVGTSMLDAFLAWLTPTGLQARVGTQETNPVRALYTRFGFVPRERHLTYHLWLHA